MQIIDDPMGEKTGDLKELQTKVFNIEKETDRQRIDFTTDFLIFKNKTIQLKMKENIGKKKGFQDIRLRCCLINFFLN